MKTIAFSLAFATLFACSNNTTPADSGATEVNDCTTFTDGTTVTGPTGATPAQYTPACVHVAVGGSVTFNVDFVDHPLEAFGGDTPNPIPNTATGTTVSVTFPTAGTYGFQCQAHPSIMHGAIQVK